MRKWDRTGKNQRTINRVSGFSFAHPSRSASSNFQNHSSHRDDKSSSEPGSLWCAVEYYVGVAGRIPPFSFLSFFCGWLGPKVIQLILIPFFLPVRKQPFSFCARVERMRSFTGLKNITGRDFRKNSISTFANLRVFCCCCWTQALPKAERLEESSNCIGRRR